LFAALGLSPLACGGTFSRAEDENGTGAGGSASGGSKASAGSEASGGSKASGGSSSNGGSKASGGSASGGGSNGCTNPTPAGAGYERCDNGTVHRPRIEECPSSLPRPTDAPITPPPVEGNCTSDADCADMPHGYCATGGQQPVPYCAYGCVKDSECGAGSICVCGDPVGHCARATCTSDDDCGDGLRCQSYDSSLGCGSQGFACQTPQDTCASDNDCMSPRDRSFCAATTGTFTCVSGGCVIGRPFLVEGCERVAPLRSRTDWCLDFAVERGALSPEQCASISQAWARVAQMEHASVAAFARFALQLLQLGAPPDLVERATAAMADETRHAQLAFGVASAYADRKLGPAALDIERSLNESSLVEVTRLVVREGCVGETTAALEAREAAAHARSPQLAALLSGVADDEARHAELAWRFVSWALDQQPQPVAEAVCRELERATGSPAPVGTAAGEPVLLEHGVLPERLRRELRKAALSEVIAPCATAMLARVGWPRRENPVLSA
jgi:hypothetical protein